MDEYITKADAILAAYRILTACGSCSMGAFCPDYGCVEVREVFENVPSADVKSVVHGKWIEQPKDFDLCGVKYFACNQCGFECQLTYNYCPHCGAIMNRGQNDG